MSREEALNKAIGILTYHQVNFCKSKEAVANMNEIIEALEKIDQEQCGDCISRQAVLEAIDVKAWEFCDYLISKGRNDEQKPVSHFADNLRECVGEDLPSVTPQPKMVERWIPVSERLPEENGQYIITVKYKHEEGYEDIYAEHGEWNNDKWDMFYFGHCGEVEKILAWMPLPEPYKQEVEE